jgi:hypothetical protein
LGELLADLPALFLYRRLAVQVRSVLQIEKS